MAAPIGNTFIEGVIGVVDVYYGGTYLGKTTAATEIAYEEDIVDIIYQQTGTKPDDKVRTGQAYMINATFGDIDYDLEAELYKGMTQSGDGSSMKIGRQLYQSMKDDEGKELVLKRVDSEGNSSTNPKYWRTFYNAGVMVTSNPAFDAGAQRSIGVQFYCFYSDTKEAFGYSGYETSLGL